MKQFQQTLEHLKSIAPFKPEMAIILGSGLGDFASGINTLVSVATNTLPGYPVSTVQGHSGKIHFAEYEGKKLLLFQGRIHFYEGYTLTECVVPVYLAKELGCTHLLLTNAAGGVNPNITPGNLMLITSYNTVFLKKEISTVINKVSPEQRERIYLGHSPEFNEIVRLSAEKEGVTLKFGSYWFTKGPTYETPAEIRMVQKFGGDAVGMSSVHEAMYSLHCGMKTAGISCITNLAAGISDTKLSHDEVTETANRVKDEFTRLLKRVIKSVEN